jgi:hypothetical protein
MPRREEIQTMTNIKIDGVEMTAAAAECVRETGADVAADVASLRSGEHTAESLLVYCLDGADDDRADGWREYVAAVVAVATRHAITDAEITKAMAGFEAGGDAGAVELCERALAGSGEARAKAAELIAYSAGNMRK